MYRSVALQAKLAGVDVTDQDRLGALGACGGRSLSSRMAKGERVLVNGEDVSEAIRTPEVSLLTARVAASPAVREAMVAQQRCMGEQGGVVLEGRDIGTVVFPQAEAKFFLSASAAERGRRRYEELKAKGANVDLDRTIAEVEARDAADTAREHSPTYAGRRCPGYRHDEHVNRRGSRHNVKDHPVARGRITP